MRSARTSSISWPAAPVFPRDEVISELAKVLPGVVDRMTRTAACRRQRELQRLMG